MPTYFQKTMPVEDLPRDVIPSYPSLMQPEPGNCGWLTNSLLFTILLVNVIILCVVVFGMRRNH